MIHNVLKAIKDELDGFLKRRLPIGVDQTQPLVLLSELMNLDGTVNEDAFDKVICTLINVEQERVSLNVRPADHSVRTNPPINLNLYVLISANFRAGNYFNALGALSSVIAYFQGKQIFTPQNTPGLPTGIERITMELVNLDMRELSNFWTAVGSKHLPSVIYKFRMVSISEDLILEELREITAVESNPKVG
ncbi:MAG: DUF4255 domain-containing protein [Saprospiraceae bacterium]|nr:DUF4255 domain-containing protein [Saprospiraceae bacterium]MCB0681777.1 DUF4255 domain-containing protein [Saprospiraceae bacterium]